jgi:hypothetical protein
MDIWQFLSEFTVRFRLKIKKSRSRKLILILLIAIWNYDSYTTKNLTPNSFNCMIAVAGKLWCSNGNTVMILNPSSLILEVVS